MMIQPVLTAEQHKAARVLCDKDREWSRRFVQPNGWTVIPADAKRPAEIAGVDNELRGQVEQFELLTELPESFGAYIGSDDRGPLLTVWTGLPLGRAMVTSSWRLWNGTKMFQYLCYMGGREYTGRGQGSGMFIGLRETAASKAKRESGK